MMCCNESDYFRHYIVKNQYQEVKFADLELFQQEFHWEDVDVCTLVTK